MFTIKQEIINNSNSDIDVYPYRAIKRINTPKTIGFFILHEGLISLVDDELLEKSYDNLSEDCTKSLQNLKYTSGTLTIKHGLDEHSQMSIFKVA